MARGNFCPACGAKDDHTSKFCTKCGQRLDGEAPVAAKPAPVPANVPKMNEMFPCGLFQPLGVDVFGVVDNGVVYGDLLFPFNIIDSITLVTAPTALTNGVARMVSGDKFYQLVYKFSDRERAVPALNYAIEKVEEAHGMKKNYRYHLRAHTGTTLEVYDTYLVINFMRTGGVGTVMANVYSGGGTGGKRINFADLTAIQFKEPAGVTVGFIQFVYPGSNEVRGSVMAALDDENSIPVSPQNLALARQIVEYVEKMRTQLRNPQPALVQQVSAADEIRKYKELLDMGVITQEEFDTKKRQLLGL